MTNTSLFKINLFLSNQYSLHFIVYFIIIINKIIKSVIVLQNTIYYNNIVCFFLLLFLPFNKLILSLIFFFQYHLLILDCFKITHYNFFSIELYIDLINLIYLFSVLTFNIRYVRIRSLYCFFILFSISLL